jgi:release factor glutamine methyltransferase
VTVLEAIRQAAQCLENAGVESPRVNAELLLADVLRVRRMELVLDSRRELSAENLAELEAKLRRREAREPVQHILGTAEFYGREFQVNRHVLVPRPETELLAEWALQTIASSSVAAPRLLDFGTGSGCLAITLALERKDASVHAVDVSTEVLAMAKANASSLKAPVTFHLGDGFAALLAGLKFDGIVSNPPYARDRRARSRSARP